MANFSADTQLELFEAMCGMSERREKEEESIVICDCGWAERENLKTNFAKERKATFRHHIERLMPLGQKSHRLTPEE